ncbi:hypothetical protein JD844_024678 [Phrynosoma platyrhinos]|uniref:TIAM Rac1 associated GEF 2 n=1 Tax=Phrynosoma platyrhinos TaxID=52577 RepID=A0ABQ7SYF2_PHRPL|nr:hypothetical protein JD844_024678 [Phrynosoma platyrhinos]
MGNSESQYSLQGIKSHGNSTSGAKQKPCSLKIRSIHSKDEKSLHGWNHSSSGTNYKSRSLARSCLSHFKNTQPYSSRISDTAVKTSKSSSHAKHRTHTSGTYGPDSNNAFLPENGFHYIDFEPTNDHATSRECNGHFLNCYGKKESPPSDDRMSPKVLIKTLGKLDGCLRVEFHNSSSNSTVSKEESSGPVQLIRYSPTSESEKNNVLEVKETSSADYPGSHRLSATDSRLRSSKGSSISSESSWYDAPWGNNGDMSELDGSYMCRSTPDASVQTSFPQSDCKKLLNQSSSLSSLRDLYRDSNLRSCQASDIGVSADYINTRADLRNHVAFTSTIDFPSEVEHRGLPQYCSYTLPCRKSSALNEDATKKETLKSRMRRISDWTGSLSRKKRKLQEPKCKDLTEYFDTGIESLSPDTLLVPSHLTASLWSPGSGQIFPQRSESASALSSDVLRQNIYENFMRELDLSRTNMENMDTSTETEDSSSESLCSLEQLDLLYEKEQGVVRKAGWLFFKPLVTLQKEKKLELVTRRKWKQYWVTLKGCTLLFYETYGRNSMEQNTSPRYALFAEDSIVQSCPEHPKKENVFCLSNSFGDVYLFQATSQTDLENWVTAIHSASASLFAKKLGKEDTVKLLKNQTKSLMQKIDMDSKMKKMAELQLSIVSDPKNRKAIENQIQQWEQNLEKFNIDLFRMRCYLASLQGGELPNPKSLLAAASRPSKMALGRLGIFSVSSFHALQKVDEFLNVYCSAPESTTKENTWDIQSFVRFPGGQGLMLTLKSEHRVDDVLTMACKIYDEIEIFPLSFYHVHLTKSDGVSDFGFAVTAQVDEQQHLNHIFVSDVLPDGMAYREGLRVGNEILVINGESVSDLDLRQMELLFSEKSVKLTLTTNLNCHANALCTTWSDGDISREPRNLLPPPNQSQLLEEFLDNFKENTANGEMLIAVGIHD